MKAFEVINPGVYTMLQDLGRPGYMRYGVPASGASDRFSAQTANLLVGNRPDAAIWKRPSFGLSFWPFRILPWRWLEETCHLR